MTATEMIKQLRAMADDLERMALPASAVNPPESRASPVDSRASPVESRGTWKRARLGKLFENPLPNGKVRGVVYLNWLENGEERSEKPSTFDEELINTVRMMAPRDSVEYQTQASKDGKFLNLVAIRLSGR
jgi:hypothetical protein